MFQRNNIATNLALTISDYREDRMVPRFSSLEVVESTFPASLLISRLDKRRWDVARKLAASRDSLDFVEEFERGDDRKREREREKERESSSSTVYRWNFKGRDWMDVKRIEKR